MIFSEYQTCITRYIVLACLGTTAITASAQNAEEPLIFSDLPPSMLQNKTPVEEGGDRYNPYIKKGQGEDYYSGEDPSYWRWSQPTFGDFQRYSSNQPFDLATPKPQEAEQRTVTASAQAPAQPVTTPKPPPARLPVLKPTTATSGMTTTVVEGAPPRQLPPATPQLVGEELLNTQQPPAQSKLEVNKQPVEILRPTVEENKNSLSLRRLAQTDLVNIEGPQNSADFHFNNSSRYRIDYLQLNLSYTSPILIRKDASQLVIKLNERIAAQIELDPRIPFNRISVPLPIDSLVKGQNTLSVEATLAHAAQNTDNHLIFQIDAAQSSLDYTGEALPVTARLSALKEMIATTDPSQPYRFHIAIPESPPLVDHMLRWGALVAQGVALQLPDLNFSLSYGSRLKRGMDNIVITRAEYVNLFLPAGSSPLMVMGPTLSIYPLPEDKNHFLLIFTGRKVDEIDQLVEAFAQPDFRLPASPTAEVFPEHGIYGQKRQINQILYLTEQLKGESNSLPSVRKEHSITFELPPSFDPASSSDGEVVLSIQSGRSQVEEGLGFPVFLNNHFLGTALKYKSKKDSGAMTFRMRLDRSLFKPGVNKLKIAALNDGSDGTLLSHSYIRIPTTSDRARIPDLGDWFSSGYPATSQPDAAGFGVQLTDGDPRTVEAAWTFLAIAARQAGEPFRKAVYSFNPIPGRGHQLLIGLLDQIAPPLNSPLLIADDRMIEYVLSPEVTTVSERVKTEDWFEKVKKKFAFEEEESEPELVSTVRHKAPGISYRIPYSQFHSAIMVSVPHDSHSSTTILSATSPGILKDAVQVLQTPEIRDLFKGDLVVWDPERPLELVANTPQTKREENVLLLESPGFSLEGYHRYIIAGIILIVLLITGYILYSLLRRAAGKVETSETEER